MENLEKWINDPTVFRINRMDAYSDHIHYATLEDADNDNQSLFKSLNGVWKFQWSKNLDQRPIDFYKTDFDVSGFDNITVPGHIEMQGYDQIQYVNTIYPFDGVANIRPPFVDKEYNPVGSYVTYFDLDNDFIDKNVCISFKGVEQAFSLFLNGEFVGYSEDTFTPSDFDLTKFIKEKDNKLCVEVYKRTSSVWIEDQDFFRFSGIFRDVILYAKPFVHIDDLWVIPNVSDDLKSGLLEVKLKMKSVPNVELILLDMDNNEVFNVRPTFNYVEKDVIEVSENKYAYYESNCIDINDIQLWHVGKSYLYTLVIKVFDEDNISEVIRQSIGFRKFEIKDAVMYLNNERVVINGVNRHEWNPRLGRAITKKDMDEDIKVLLNNNINAVRTSHYPNQSYWYELCDKHGIMMMDEANLESHGSWQKLGVTEPSWNVPGSLPQWRDNVVDRAVSMFERDKNHPSILWWSCGNEAFSGSCITNMGDYFRSKDSSRVVHYEGSFWNREFDEISDIETRMYELPCNIEKYLLEDGKKPFILCEYMHNMGNSIGGMESYIELVDKYPSYQGGFIWDYMDQALYYDKNGVEVLGYGGDFGDRPSDYNFSGNGIVTANRQEKPAMQDVRYWYSTIEQRARHDKENEEQINKLNTNIEIDSGSLSVIYGDGNLGVRGSGFDVQFSYVDGGLASLKYDNHEWLYRSIKPTYWRATTENDVPTGFVQRSAIWNLSDMYSKHTNYDVEVIGENEVKITFTYDPIVDTDSFVEYTVYGDGTIKVKSTLKANKSLPQLPQYGVKFSTTKPIDDYEFVGYSGETYPDRFKGGVFSRHTDTVRDAIYLMPQEHGCHYNSHELILNQDGHKLGIYKKDKPFHFSVLNHTSQELENALHQEELPNNGRNVIRILSNMRGVGGINTWGAEVEDKYHIHLDQDLELEFFLRNVKDGE